MEPKNFLKVSPVILKVCKKTWNHMNSLKCLPRPTPSPPPKKKKSYDFFGGSILNSVYRQSDFTSLNFFNICFSYCNLLITKKIVNDTKSVIYIRIFINILFYLTKKLIII